MHTWLWLGSNCIIVYYFICMYYRMGDQCYQNNKILTNKNVAGDDREGTTGGIVGRKRSSPSSQTDTYKHSRPLVCSYLKYSYRGFHILFY